MSSYLLATNGVNQGQIGSEISPVATNNSGDATVGAHYKYLWAHGDNTVTPPLTSGGDSKIDCASHFSVQLTNTVTLAADGAAVATYVFNTNASNMGNANLPNNANLREYMLALPVLNNLGHGGLRFLNPTVPEGYLTDGVDNNTGAAVNNTLSVQIVHVTGTSFTLPTLNSTVQLLAADIDDVGPAALGTHQLDAVVEVDLAAMRNVFKFTMDGVDVTNSDADVQFQVDADAFAAALLNGSGAGLLGAAMTWYANTGSGPNMSGVTITPSQYIYSQSEKGYYPYMGQNGVNTTTHSLCYDMVRDIAAKAFGPNLSSYAAYNNVIPDINAFAADNTDKFLNEDEMRIDAFTKVNALVEAANGGGSIYNALDAANGRHTSTAVVSGVSPDTLVNGADETNIGRRLLQQILALPAGSRRTESLATLHGVTGTGVGTGAGQVYHMPLIENDVIQFNLVQDNSNQNNVNQLSDNPDMINRTIRMNLICKSSPSNFPMAN